jgi:hypothetical protein
MPDRVQELFAELRRADLPVPPSGRVAARGRQLRRRSRLQVCGAAVAVIAATGLVAHLVTASGGHGGRPVLGLSQRPTSPAPARTTSPGSTVLPPAGDGPLILGLDASDHFVMTRTGSGGRPVPVPGLPAVAGGPSDIATDPAGGWVVTYSANPNAPYGSQTARLAVVTPDGRGHAFGSPFSGVTVTSVAVSPDGSRVAVALSRTPGAPLSASQATIEVLPTPGHAGGTRTWIIPAPLNYADNLSWAPDGRHLTYAVGVNTGAGIGGYPVTLDITAPGAVAPDQSGWPQAGKGATTAAGRAACPPDVGAWLGTSGKFAALEECDGSQTEVVQPAHASDGAATGPASTIPGARPGSCAGGALDPAPAGNPILITYCGVYLDDRGRISRLPGGLTAAALAG